MTPISTHLFVNRLTALFAIAFFLLPGLLFAGQQSVISDPAAATVINDRCTGCHSVERIKAAIKTGTDMAQVEQKMIKLGADLSSRERSVLGTFWGTPLKAESAPADDSNLTQYRAIMAARCTGCHSIDRIVTEMKNRSFTDVAEAMAKRGVTLSTNEQSVLGTFWGSPLRD